MKRFLLIVNVLMAAAVAVAGELRVCSPDGSLCVEVTCQGGVPKYMVMLGNDTVLCPSQLGMTTSMGDYTSGLSLEGMDNVQAVGETYTMRSVKKAQISYNANRAVFHFAKNGKAAFDVTMHVDNNNVAFRYHLYASNKDTKSCRVNGETTSYAMPEGTTTFICPQMKPHTGFASTAPSYETFYEFDGEMGKNGEGHGYTFPALFKVPGASGNNATGQVLWLMLSETNVAGNYCASRFVCDGPRSYTLAYPEKEEFGGIGSCEPGVMLDRQDMPWRTITVGRTLAPIAETTIQWDLVKQQYEPSCEYRYGRSAWSWIIRMDPSCNYDEQKEYVDFAAAMGWEYLLVDALWDTQIGYQRMAELSEYAQSKGVNLFLWYNSNGYWNDAPQGPRGKMHRMIDRRREMAWMQKIGVKGIKVDFVGSDKQQTMQMYEDILADANDYGLMVIFHGCTLQRGWERMYPNFVSCEALRASENLSFGQYDNDVEARNGTIHPVLRNAVGNMDFGGTALNKRYSKDNKHGKIRRTSDVYQLATAILFQTPVQNFALAPNNLTDAPQWAMDFMKTVPVTWEDLRFIDGYPGKYLVMARKHAGKWYLAAVNAEEKPLTLTLNLAPFFDADASLTLYSDSPKLEGSVSALKQNRKRTLKVTIPCNGGLIVK